MVVTIASAPSAALLETRDLSVGYPRGPVLLSKLYFTLRAGEVVSILGRNGVGKSTLLRTLTGHLPARGGHVHLGRDDLRHLKPAEIAKRIAVVPQFHSAVFAFTVADLVLMGRTARIGTFRQPGKADERKAMAMLERVGLAHIADRPVPQSSGGQRQMALIARALLQEPTVLALDEPTSHLDMANQVQVLDLLADLSSSGLAILMTSHFPEHALGLGGRALMLGGPNGLHLGDAADVVTEEALEAAYGVSVELVRSPRGRVACIPVHASDDSRA